MYSQGLNPPSTSSLLSLSLYLLGEDPLESPSLLLWVFLALPRRPTFALATTGLPILGPIGGQDSEI